MGSTVGGSKPRKHSIISLSSRTPHQGGRRWEDIGPRVRTWNLGVSGRGLPPSTMWPSDEGGTPWTREEWDQGQGPESLGVEQTYRNDLRTFQWPWTRMEESEMDRLRPWPGRGVKAELSSSQLWMCRLWRETRRAASALAGALTSPCTFPQWGLDQQGCFRQVSAYPHVPSACCVPHTNHTARQAPCTHCVRPHRGVRTVLVPFSRRRK